MVWPEDNLLREREGIYYWDILFIVTPISTEKIKVFIRTNGFFYPLTAPV
jgi:hypothetical protein